jgi:hypothetical protein
LSLCVLELLRAISGMRTGQQRRRQLLNFTFS